MPKKKELSIKPLRRLIDRHTNHTGKYRTKFRGIELTIYPSVLNPNYTKVSGFLSDNISIPKNSTILDMFCGSGALGLVHIDKAKSLLGIDISNNAISCAKENSKNLSLDYKTTYRQGDVWETVKTGEAFDVIIANPPLLPLSPHTKFESSFADSPEMKINKNFVKGCEKHLKKDGVAYISNSSASDIVNQKGESIDVITNTARKFDLNTEIIAELDAGYEVYRVIKITKN